jgi:eukaryotic-like serine/threonine-protein kinase
VSYSQHPLDNKLLLGRYRVMRLLGEGGMGTVHLARVEGAEGFTRAVVVKRMRSDIKTTEEGHRLFTREAKILSKLQHPGIVGISDFGVEDGAHIMVLEYVHGFPLSAWIEYRQRQNQPIPVDVCLFVVRRVLDALHYAHRFDTEEGREIEIVHRDISPDNALLSNKGYVHLLDFGIASMRGPQAGGSTKTGAFRGKLCYAAPETIEGKPATPRSDQYSTAVVLLEMLILETPFATESIAMTFGRMLHEVPEPPSKTRDDIPPGLDETLARALAKAPEARFENAQAFARELRRVQQDDDDDVAQKLRDLVRQDFESLPLVLGIESLRQREEALEKILSVFPAPLRTEQGDWGDAANKEEWSREQEKQRAARKLKLPATVLDGNFESEKTEPTPAAAVAPPATSGNRQIQGLLVGLLVVGALIAVGLGASVALLSRGGGNDQVVVVGGDSPEEPEATAPSAPAPDARLSAGPAEPIAPTAGVDPADPRAVQTADSALRTGSPRPNPGESAPGDQGAQLSRAVQQQSGNFQGCFAKHVEPGAAAPEAVLHFSVAKSGGSAQVEIEPPALAAAPLGGCLKAAAVRVQFPELDQSVSFRVPVRARISRTKEPG